MTRRILLMMLGVGGAGLLAYPLVRLGAPDESAGSPTIIDPSLEKGLELYRDQKYEEAVQEFTAALRAQPELKQAYVLRGALSNLGEQRDAVSDFSEALRRQPADAVLYLYRGQSYLALGSREEAAQDFRKAAEFAVVDQRVAVAARVQLRQLEGSP